MNITIASSPSKIAACQQILREVFVVEHGFDLVIPDKHEPRSIYLCAEDASGEVVGALRIVVKQPGFDIPLGDVISLPSLKNLGCYGEISRMAILPTYRGKTLNLAAYSVCWELGKKFGLDYFVIEARHSIRAFYKRLGYKEYGAPFYDPAMQEPDDENGLPNAVIMIAGIEALLTKTKRRACVA